MDTSVVSADNSNSRRSAPSGTRRCRSGAPALPRTTTLGPRTSVRPTDNAEVGVVHVDASGRSESLSWVPDIQPVLSIIRLGASAKRSLSASTPDAASARPHATRFGDTGPHIGEGLATRLGGIGESCVRPLIRRRRPADAHRPGRPVVRERSADRLRRHRAGDRRALRRPGRSWPRRHVVRHRSFADVGPAGVLHRGAAAGADGRRGAGRGEPAPPSADVGRHLRPQRRVRRHPRPHGRVDASVRRTVRHADGDHHARPTGHPARPTAVLAVSGRRAGVDQRPPAPAPGGLARSTGWPPSPTGSTSAPISARSGATASYLAFVGRLCPEKRPDIAVEIAARTGWPLRVAAKVDPSDEEYFEEQIAPLFEAHDVDFVGELGEDDKPAFYAGAAATLFPSDWPEPFGLVMIESLAAGTPVIALRRGSVPEVLVDGVCGFVCDDAEAMVAAVARLDEIHPVGVPAAGRRLQRRHDVPPLPARLRDAARPKTTDRRTHARPSPPDEPASGSPHQGDPGRAASWNCRAVPSDDGHGRRSGG